MNTARSFSTAVVRGLLLTALVAIVAITAVPQQSEAAVVVTMNPRSGAVVAKPAFRPVVVKAVPLRSIVASRFERPAVARAVYRSTCSLPGRYVWVPGHWVKKPYRPRAWVRGHWRRVR